MKGYSNFFIANKKTNATWHWTHDDDSWRGCHSINYWIPLFPQSNKLIADQLFRNQFWKLNGISINNSANLKQENFYSQVIKIIHQKPQTRLFSKKNNKKTKTKTKTNKKQQQQQKQLFKLILSLFPDVTSSKGLDSCQASTIPLIFTLKTPKH